jgi:ATP-binding cassette subfamily C protein
MDGVTFRYEGQETRPAIADLDLTIDAGSTTAIVGPSGAGKSTIADLLLGLLTPQEGGILIDGRPLVPAAIRSWRRHIGYVAQDTLLFHATVRENLQWACPEATDSDIGAALRLAAAEAFVSGLPRGLDTVVGDRGVLLSGGERQRLSLARALLRKPRLLILDEATSSLDSENEARIQHAIEDLHARMTIVVIAHQLSTIRSADLIYVVDQGRVVEHGTWADLTTRPAGRFLDLCRAQGLDDARLAAGQSAKRAM